MAARKADHEKLLQYNSYFDNLSREYSILDNRLFIKTSVVHNLTVHYQSLK